MIQVRNLSKSFTAKSLLYDVSFFLGERERVGLVGRNGSGKSTLFRMILGEEAPDSGEIIFPKGYKIGSLSQHICFTKNTLLDECTQLLKGEEQFDFYKAEKILTGLGFSEEDFNLNPKSFSGGQQLRINLCKSLLNNPNLLLLDEPTNYLDIVSIRWLKAFLKTFPGEVMIITHDRDFMDTVTTHTAGIQRGGLRKIRGSTEKYYAKAREEENIHEKTRKNQEKKKEDMMKNINRFRTKASRASQAQSKLKQLEKLNILEKLTDEHSLDFFFRYRECPAKILLEAEGLSFAYDKEPLFQDLKFSINKTDRVGIIGKNGKGKSTLLNVLSGELEQKTGGVKCHPNVRIGHFGQTNVDRLYMKNTVIQEIQESNEGLSFTEVRKIAGTMLFSGDDGKKEIKVLSGGERARVMLGKILATPCNLLLLDEPTNHLDMESVESLMEEIKKFSGACLMVTHNELLLREICNRLIIFHRNGAEFFYGGYDDFLNKIGWDEESNIDSNISPKQKISRKDHKRMRSEIIKERGRECTPLQDKIKELEKLIGNLEKDLEKKNREIVDSDSSGHLEELSREISKIHKDIESHFLTLEKLTERYDNRWSYFTKNLSDFDFFT